MIKIKRKIEVVRADDIAFIDARMSERHDADITAIGSGQFFKRQLEHVYSTTYQASMPMPNSLRLFPVDTEINEGATSYVHRMMEPVGEAIVISNYGNDLPRVNTVMREEVKQLKDIGNSYSYSIKDIASARMTGANIDGDRAYASREAIERKHNEIFWWGLAEFGLYGALNHNSIPRFIFSVALNSASDPDDVVNELNAYVNSVNALTKTTAFVDTLVLPADEYAYVMSTPRSPNSDTTIGQFLILNNPFLKTIEQAWELGGDIVHNNGQSLAFAYRKSPLVAKVVAPIIYRQLPMERKNLEFVTNCTGMNGGFYSPKPLEICVGELLA
jgi:hypothetical protein